MDIVMQRHLRSSAVPGSGRATVLVVEDDRELRALLALRLRRFGMEVVEAADGEAALDLVLAAPTRFAAIVSDVRMPRRSGLDLLGEVRGAGLALPVVLMTGFGERQTHADALDRGATLVVDKPVDVDGLCRQLAALLALQPAVG
jgi:DNA-binding NtrC family response regulator